MFIKKKISYMRSNYENVIVNKPWGYEYLAYQNDEVALWLLYIKYDHDSMKYLYECKYCKQKWTNV